MNFASWAREFSERKPLTAQFVFTTLGTLIGFAIAMVIVLEVMK